MRPRLPSLLMLAAVAAVSALAGISPPSAHGAEEKVLILPFPVSPPDSPVAWLGPILPLHIANELIRQGLTVETVTDPAGAPDPVETPLEEMAAWLATREAQMVIGGVIQEATASVSVNGRIVTRGGAGYPFSFSAKLSDLPSIMTEPALLALEIVTRHPTKHLWPMQMAPPRPLLNRRELSLGAVPTPAEFVQSETLYKTAIKVDPNNADAYYQLGTLYGRMEDWPNSIANLQEAAKKSPKYVKYHIALGVVYFRSGSLDEAMGEFVQVSMLDERSAEGFYDLSVVYRETGDLDKAESALKQAAAADPAYPLLKLGSSIILYYRGEPAEAIRELQELLAGNPRISEAHNNLGVITLESGGATADAIKIFQRALAADEGNLAAKLNIGVAQLMEGKIPEAVKTLENVRNLNPKFAAAFYNLGCAFYQTGKLPDALALFRKALTGESGTADALVNIGVSRYILGDFPGSQQSLEQAIISLDNPPPLAYYNLGVLHQMFGRQKEALINYLKANKKSHRIPAAHINLGTTYEEMGQDSKALNEYLKALALTTEIPEVYLSLGMIYYKLGYQELAFETMKKSTMVSFSDPAGYFYLGRFLETTDRARAADYYKIFLDNIIRDPNRAALWRQPMEEKLKELGQ